MIHALLIPELERGRQEDQEFKVTLSYIAQPGIHEASSQKSKE